MIMLMILQKKHLSSLYLYQWHTVSHVQLFHFHWKGKNRNYYVLNTADYFLVPLILLFPIFYGIDGVMYAGPIADAAAVILVVCFTLHKMKKIRVLETEESI